MNNDPSQNKLLKFISINKAKIQTEQEFNSKFQTVFKDIMVEKIIEYSNILSSEINHFLKTENNINDDGQPSFVAIRVFRKDQSENLDKENVPQLWITTNMIQRKLRFMENLNNNGLDDIIQMEPENLSAEKFSEILGTFLEKSISQKYD